MLAFTFNVNAETIKANCLIDEYNLQSQKIDKSEQKALAGKVIRLELDTGAKLLFDKSDENRITILTGITEEGVEYQDSITMINYESELDVIDRESERKLKYMYKNSLLLENNEITSLIVNIDQTGFTLNKWKFAIGCRSNDYTDIEKQIARRSFPEEDKSLDISKYKVDENGKPILFIYKNEDNTIPENYILQVDITKFNTRIALNKIKPENADDLLNYYKAKLFENNKDISIPLVENRKYLKFERGQRIFYEDIKDLDERKFFRLPLEDSMDKHSLKIYKKEYFEEKKNL